MKMDTYESGPVTVLRLDGDMNEEGANQLRLILAQYQEKRRTRVVLNMGAVTYVSYLAVAALLERLQVFRRQGGDIKLASANVYTQRLLRMSSALHFFHVCDNESGAIEAFREAA